MLLAACAVIAPVLFWATILIAASLRPGYDHARHAISDLGLGANAEFVNATFVAYGMATFLIALGLRTRLRGAAAARGSTLLALSGAGIAGLGVEWFVGVAPPLFQPLHNVLALVAYIGGTGASFAVAEGLRGEARHARLAAFSRAAGVLAAGLIGAAALDGLGLPAALAAAGLGDGRLPDVNGALQRVLTVDLQLWVAVVGSAALRAERTQHARSGLRHIPRASSRPT